MPALSLHYVSLWFSQHCFGGRWIPGHPTSNTSPLGLCARLVYSWGVSLSLLLLVYRGLVRAYLKWGSPLFAGACRSVLGILNRAQYEAFTWPWAACARPPLLWSFLSRTSRRLGCDVLFWATASFLEMHLRGAVIDSQAVFAV